MARPEKEKTVTELVQKFKTTKDVYFVDFTRLNVQTIDELRRKLRESSVEFKVVKNTLTRLALKQLGYEFLNQFVEGPTALTFNTEEPIVSAKLLVDFRKQHQYPEIKGGFLDGELLEASKIEELVKLPSKQILIAQVISGLHSPILKFVLSLKNILYNFVVVIDAIAKKSGTDKQD